MEKHQISRSESVIPFGPSQGLAAKLIGSLRFEKGKKSMNSSVSETNPVVARLQARLGNVQTLAQVIEIESLANTLGILTELLDLPEKKKEMAAKKK